MPPAHHPSERPPTGKAGVARVSAGRRAVAVGAIALASFGLFVPASADDGIADARKKREDARNAQLQAARQINVLTAADADLAAALSTIEAAVIAQQARVDDARRQLTDAHAELVARESELAAADAALSAANEDMQRVLINRYVGAAFETPQLVLKATDASDALRREALLDIVHGHASDKENALLSARVERDRALQNADNALAESERLRQAVTVELTELQSRQSEQVSARDELQRRLTAWRAQQDQLEAEESQLTDLIKKRQLEVLKVADAGAAAASVKGFIAPAKGKIESNFGPRMHPIFHEMRPHNGVDIDAKTGDAVWAAKEGKVLFAGTMTGFGNVIILDHGSGVSTLYAHLSKILVTPNVSVAKGEVIGLVGSTGWATGPHLHFEVRIGGTPKDPMLFLP